MNTPIPSAATLDFRVLCSLVKKDWRLFRVPLVALIIVGAGCYLIALVGLVEIYQEYWRYKIPNHPGAMSAGILFPAAVAANGFTCLLAAAMGGIAIAGERAERTSDFLALLPVSRLQIILAKLLSGALMIGVFALFHLVVALICLPYAQPTSLIGRASIVLPSLVWFGCTLSLFGVGWLFSSLTTSGPISACLSMAVTAVAVVLTISTQGHPQTDQQLFFSLIGVMFAIGVPCLIAGSICYVNRVAP